MFSATNTEQKKTRKFWNNKKNVMNVLSLNERPSEATIKKYKQQYNINSTQKINKKRNKHIVEENQTQSANNNYFNNKKSEKRFNKRKKKRQNLQSTFFRPYLRKSLHDHIFEKECFSKESLQSKSSEKKTLNYPNEFVSLDFIENCQNYKKKFMKPMFGQELKHLRKSLRNISSYHKRYLSTIEQTQKSQAVNKSNKQVLRCKNLQQKKYKNSPQTDSEVEAKKIERHCSVIEYSPFLTNNSADAEELSNGTLLNSEFSSYRGKLRKNCFLLKQPFKVKRSSEDISTIDKKYIESLLSIAPFDNMTQKNYIANYNLKEIEPCGGTIKLEKKKKITGKVFFENKLKKEKMKEKHFKNIKNIEQTEIPKKPGSQNKATISSPENTLFVRLIRDLTKSEVQIQHKKKKIPYNSGHSETESKKKIAHSKPEVNNSSKKRKTRNNALKNNTKQVTEMPFSGEVSKVMDVQELWRRETSNKSDNSLSSRSSSTIVQGTGEVLRNKTSELHSYKTLRKVVEEEVHTICKKYVEKKTENNLNESESNKSEFIEEPKKFKKMYKELRAIMSENTSKLFNLNETKMNEVVKRRFTENNQQKNYLKGCDNEGEREKDDLLECLDKYESEDLDPTLLKEKKKVPSEAVQNWSILHRLEQAFLALGTPTFPNHKIKDSNTLKVKGLSGTEKNIPNAEKFREGGLNQNNKKRQKSKDILEKKEKNSVNVIIVKAKFRRDPSEGRLSKLSSSKFPLQSSRNKRAESDSKQLLQKEKLQGIKNFRNGSRQSAAVSLNCPAISKNEDKLKQKTEKLQIKKPNMTDTKKSLSRSLAKPKICEFESRYSKKEAKQKKCKHIPSSKSSFLAKTKSHDAKTVKLITKKPKTLVFGSNQNEDENLERKKTFDVIPLKDSAVINSRKSKSCNKIDDTFELDNVKKRFTPTKNIECKNLWNFPEEKKNRSLFPNQEIGNDTITRTENVTLKNFLKVKPFQLYEKPKIHNEKECFKENRESSLKSLKGRLYHDKKFETAVPVEDLPQQILVKKKMSDWKDRAIKERSILSIRGNQHSNQTQKQNLLHLQGKTVCNFSLEPEPNKHGEDLLEKEAPNILLDMCEQVPLPDTLNISNVSTGTFEVSDFTVSDYSHPSQVVITSLASLNESDMIELSSLSSLSVGTLEQQQDSEEVKMTSLKNQPLWEYDMKQYRAIVKEIMSQYKRIDGFLKQNEHSQSFANCSDNMVSKEYEVNDELGKLTENLQAINIHEYRKKIISEYQALPIFEYKTKIQQEAANKKSEEKRKNLSFVKTLKKEMDLDVKDFKPNIQRILDSQLYVEPESLFRRNKFFLKCSEKNSSLQEIVLTKNEKEVKEEECLRCISTPKTFLSPLENLTYSSSAQNLPTALNITDKMGIEKVLLNT